MKERKPENRGSQENENFLKSYPRKTALTEFLTPVEFPEKQHAQVPTERSSWQERFPHVAVPIPIDEKSKEQLEEDKRAADFAYTGDGSYLTPALARKLSVSREVMEEVPGASAEDIAWATHDEERRRKEDDEWMREHDNAYLRPYGLDAETLNSLTTHEQVKPLLIGASVYRRNVRDDHHEFIQMFSHKKLRELIEAHPKEIAELFAQLDPAEIRTLDYVFAVEELYTEYTHNTSLDSKKIEEVRNVFINTATETRERISTNEDARYLIQQVLLLETEAIESGAKRGPLNIAYEPSALTHELSGMLNADGGRLMVLPNSELTSLQEYELADAFLDAGQNVSEFLNAPVEEGTLRTFVLLHHPKIQKTIAKDFGFQLTDLDLHEQFYLLQYLTRVRVSDAEGVKHFCKTYGVEGLGVFLATEQLGIEFGDNISEFGNRMHAAGTPDIARAAFQHFTKLQDEIGKVTDSLRKNFNVSGAGEEVSEIEKHIKIRSAQFLDEAIRSSKDTEDSGARVLEAIANARAEAIAFVSAFKVLRERGELSLELMRDTSLQMVSSSQLREDGVAKEQMIEILRTNYRSAPETFRTQIEASLESSFTSPHSHFYVLRHNDEVIAFCRFDERRDAANRLTELYFGSFNTSRAFGNGKLGEVILETTVRQELEHGVPISANCNPLSPITQKYIETGFVATKLEDYATVPSFSITLDTAANAGYVSKRWTKEAVVRAALGTNTNDIRAFGAKKPDELPFELVNEGFVLTRFTKEGERLYAVFERAASVTEEEGGTA